MSLHTLCQVDELLKLAYTGGFTIQDPRKTRDPLCLEWKRLGGFGALRGRRAWEDCPRCVDADGSVKPEYLSGDPCECEHGERHETPGMACGFCNGTRGGFVGRWEVRPTRDKAKRKRLRAILKKAGELRLMVFESGGIAGTLNESVPLYDALLKAGKKKPKKEKA